MISEPSPASAPQAKKSVAQKPKTKPQPQKTKANGQVFRFLLLHLQGNCRIKRTDILLTINQNFNTP